MQNVTVKQFGLICGGTGITPMYQVIKAILDNPADKTNVVVLFGNKTEEDILLRQELEGIMTDPRFKVHFTLDIVIDVSCIILTLCREPQNGRA